MIIAHLYGLVGTYAMAAVEFPDPGTMPTEASSAETWSAHGQFTNVTQWQPSFKAPYSGANSLVSGNREAETSDLTLFLGARLWQGGELYGNFEIDQGFGLSNTLGVAGFTSGEAYKVGASHPYGRLPRLFLRQVIELGGDERKISAAANQLGGSIASNNITLTFGKLSVVDLFDTNMYAHDPRTDFLNWAIIDSGAFDYAADAWGFTAGAALEWTQSWWTLRGGFFALSNVPNSTKLDTTFSQYEWVGEFEARGQLLGHPGKAKLLWYENRGYMGAYSDAVRLAQQSGGTPDTALVRNFATSPGIAINLEQELTSDLGFFARASVNDGGKEAFDFTEINQSLSTGFALQGDRWNRHDDTVGLAAVMNGLSDDARRYFSTGGMGVLIGDGRLNYDTERIAEVYYNWQMAKWLALGADYQHITNPAYNRDRGPVSVFGMRLHAEY
jgi:high affinity Mn2+ porin